MHSIQFSTVNCQRLALLPAAYLLSLSGDVHAVWWSFPIAEVVSMVITVLLFIRIYRQKIKPLMRQGEEL